MKRYKNTSGDSGVTYYEIGEDFILIKFTGDGNTYKYSNSVNGEHHIDSMKKLAIKGKGLATYIAKHPEIKNHFERV